MPKVTAPANVLTKAFPDAEEEVRHAVRRLLDHLQVHPETRADRLVIAFRSATPYARLLSEQLSAAGLPFHAPRQRTLAQTIGGRTVLGLLALPDEQWSRTASWTGCATPRSATVRTGCPSTAGSSKQPRPGSRAASSNGRESSSTTRARSPSKRSAARTHAAGRDLTSFMDALIERLDSLESAQTWAESAAELRATVDRYLGGPNAAAGWGAGGDLRNDQDVLTAADLHCR